MNKTTNLGLSLYEADDKFAITASEDSLNHNMELIDNAFSNISVETLYDVIKEAGYTGTEEEFNSAVLGLANKNLTMSTIRSASEFGSILTIGENGTTIYPCLGAGFNYEFNSDNFSPSSNSIANIGTVEKYWKNIYAENIYKIKDGIQLEVATKEDLTSTVEETLAAKSNQLTEGENIRLIPNDDGTIRVSAFEGFNTDLNELSLIASGETTEEVRWIELNTDADGNSLNLRDFIWIFVQVPKAAQDTRLSVWLDSFLIQVNAGLTTANAKDSKVIAYFTGLGWDYMSVCTTTGNEYAAVQSKMKSFAEKENTVNRIRIGCYTSTHILPIGTTYKVYGRKK